MLDLLHNGHNRGLADKINWKYTSLETSQSLENVQSVLGTITKQHNFEQKKMNEFFKLSAMKNFTKLYHIPVISEQLQKQKGPAQTLVLTIWSVGSKRAAAAE